MKKLLGFTNTEKTLLTMAENILTYTNLKEKDVTAYLSNILKGIIHQSTVRKYMPEKFKHCKNIRVTCDLCGKTRIKNLTEHKRRTHGVKQIVN